MERKMHMNCRLDHKNDEVKTIGFEYLITGYFQYTKAMKLKLLSSPILSLSLLL